MVGRLLISVLITSLAVACGPDDNNDRNSRNIIPGNNPTNNTNNTNNTNGMTNGTIGPINNGFGPECADLECQDGRRCVRGVCVMDDLKVACESPEELGELAEGVMYMGTGDNSQFADGVSTMCASELEELYSGAEFGFTFTVPTPGSVRFDVLPADASFEWVAEMRLDCANPGALPAENNMPVGFELPFKCTNSPVLSFGVEPGTEYFILVEPNNSIDYGTFDWELTYEPDACERSRVCVGDDIVYCDGEEEVTLACGTGCEADACVGDSCDTAIEVTAAMSFSGDITAFTSTLDFENTANCNEDPMSAEGTATSGEEIVFRLPGLTAGATVTIDTSMDDISSDIFVLDSCSQSATCLAVTGSNYLEWTVEADGDYFVVVDKGQRGQEDLFNVAIDIQ